MWSRTCSSDSLDSLSARQRLVEPAAVGLGGVVQLGAQIAPAGLFRDEEGVVVVRVLAVAALRLVLDHALCDLAPDDALALGLEHVRAALEKQQAEDVVLVGGGVHPLLAQPVGGGVEVTFELGE